jgi:hypothetical protein
VRIAVADASDASLPGGLPPLAEMMAALRQQNGHHPQRERSGLTRAAPLDGLIARFRGWLGFRVKTHQGASI